MGTYVKVVPRGHRRDLGDKDSTPTTFVLTPGIVSQKDLESAAGDWDIPLVCTDRGTAEKAASRLGVVLERRKRFARRG